MRVFGIKICITGEERSITLTATFIQGSSKMIVRMALAFISTPMAANMSVTGNRTSNTVLVKKSGSMAVSTKGFTEMEINMVKASINGPTITSILVSGKTTS